MIRKNILGCLLLTGLFFFACKKENNSLIKNATTSAVAPNKISANTLKDSVAGKTEQPVSTPKTENSSLRSSVKNNTIEGRFVARNCENGRFSIVISNSGGTTTFKVYDGKKVISSGKAEISKESDSNEINITMGNIGGIYADDILTIQNYGNSMNEFEHFTQCEDKYLEFAKE
ncbi:hypothetical protein [Chryseobacterium defluvii]|uniref:Lipoprotein n=1 Tax=Chryseobacterium defluvii TaxID=160396 RepID=A0A495SBY1_9FLAO|nr:hypothetical protein [Chryseobacterium defluvii]RKS97394.1 hypothetical protein BCF58_1516 [Chryseobacterium defluvii]